MSFFQNVQHFHRAKSLLEGVWLTTHCSIPEEEEHKLKHLASNFVLQIIHNIRWSKAFIINKHHANPHPGLILPPTTFTNNQYLSVMFCLGWKTKTKKGTSEHNSEGWQFGKILSFFMFCFYKTFKIRKETSKLEFLSMMTRNILTVSCPVTENWYCNIWFLPNRI